MTGNPIQENRVKSMVLLFSKCLIWHRKRTASFRILGLQNLYSPVRIRMAPRETLQINASRAVRGVDFLFSENLGPLCRFLVFSCSIW